MLRVRLSGYLATTTTEAGNRKPDENPLERLNGEAERRTNAVGIFPNVAAVGSLVGAILLEQNDEWAAERRDVSLETRLYHG